MQRRDELEKKIVYGLDELIGYSQKQGELSAKLMKNWDMSLGHASDLVSQRVGLDAETDFTIFVLASELEIKGLNKYFSKIETKEFSNAKYEKKGFKLPLKLDMLQVSSDQWIGRIMISDLMTLRDAQIITYNENTQRTIERVIRGNKEFYRITVDNSVVNKIAMEYEEEQYIPNTLTFNMPENTSFKYDSDKKQLIISELTNLDIIDGYHRYLGAAKALMKNPELDYPMELRIVFFPEGKARQFIWQEDQKTKMTKLDSQSFNQYNYGNTLTQYLNMNPEFVASGLIGKRGIIDAGYLGQILDELCFKNKKEKEAKDRYIELRKTLIPKFNEILDEIPSLLEERWSYRKTLSVIYVVLNWNKSDGKKEDVYKRFYNNLEDNYQRMEFRGLTGHRKATLSSIYNKCKKGEG